jgi:4-amino-4-deoxy-L-arabinose transferase-like glycosyltransferase
MLASRLWYGCRTCLADGRALITGDVLREFLTTIIKNLWPAYLLASILILCGFWWSFPNAYQNKSFHFDEDLGISAVQQISFPQFNPHVFNIGTGFFYQVYLIKLVLTAGGLLHAGTTEILLIGRSLVFASALGAITVLFFLGRKLFNASTGRLAALILAVLPGFVINSHYFKADVPLTLWILLTILVAYQFLDTGNSKVIFLLGLLVGYTTAVKPNGGVLLPVGFVVMVMRPPKAHKIFAWTSYLVCVGIGFVVGEPLVLLPQVWPEIIRDLRHLREVNRWGVIYHVARPPAWIDYPLNVFPFSFTGPMLIASAVALVWVLVRWRTKCLPILTFWRRTMRCCP